MTAPRGLRRFFAAFRRKAVFDLPASDSVGLSPEPAFGPPDPFFSYHFNAVAPDNGFSRQLDVDITAYRRSDVTELDRRIAVDTTQPILYIPEPVAGRREDRDEYGRSLVATLTKHPAGYVPLHAAREDEDTADLGTAVVGFLDAWHRPWLRPHAEARTAPLFGGAA